MVDVGAQKEVVADRDAFESMYRQMAPKVYRYCTSRLGVGDGEEVVSETFHAAAKAFNDGRYETLTPAWLMTVARNKVIDRWRSIERQRQVTQLYEASTRSGMLSEDPVEVDVRRDWVEATLEAISSRHRMLLTMHYVEEMRAAEIADALDSSLASIESALARARAAFRRHYREARAS